MVSIHSSPRITINPIVKHPSFLRSILYTSLAVLGVVFALQTLGSLPVLVAFGSLVFHEYGHYWACKRFNIPVEEIKITIFGGCVTQERPAESALRTIAITGVGPLFGLLPLAIVYPLALFTNADALSTTCSILVFGHLINYIPYGPLDGGIIRDAITHIISQSRFIPGFASRPVSWIITGVQLIVLFFVFGAFGIALTSL